MLKRQTILLILFITSFITSVCSINLVQNNPSTQIEKEDYNAINEISVPETSGYAVSQKWKWNNPWQDIQVPLQVEISKDGNYIVARWNDPISTYNPNVTLFTKDSNSTVWIYECGSGIIDVAISGDGKYIAVSNTSHIMLLDYSVATPKKALWQYPNYPNIENKYVDISLTGDYISAINNTHLILLDKTGEVQWMYNCSPALIQSEAVAISGDGEYIVIGCKNGINNWVYLFNRTDFQDAPMWEYLTSNIITKVAISEDGNYAVASNMNCDVYFFNTTDYQGIPMWSWNGASSNIDLAISSYGTYVALSDGDDFYYFNNSFSAGWGKQPMWSFDVGLGENTKYVDINEDGMYVIGGTYAGPSAHLFNNSITNPKDDEWSYPDDIMDVTISGWGNYFAIGTSKEEIIVFHHDRPIPRVFAPYVADDDDDDEETPAIPFGDYYLVFTFTAIVALIIIIRRRAILIKNKL